MKSNYVLRATKFMEAFYPYMRKYRNLTEAVEVFNEEKHRAVEWRSGAVRRVLVTSDYVIKWDYNKGNSRTFGGCREEYKKYLEVKDSDFSYLFAEITPIRVHNRTFYVMPRVRMLGYDCEEYFYDTINKDEYDFLNDVACVGDIHDENWGYYHGQPTIIDYACCSFNAS